MSAPEPSIQIGMREVYDKLLIIEELAKSNGSEVADLRKDVDELRGRTAALEARRWPMPALSITVTILLAFIAYLVQQIASR